MKSTMVKIKYLNFISYILPMSSLTSSSFLSLVSLLAVYTINFLSISYHSFYLIIKKKNPDIVFCSPHIYNFYCSSACPD